MINTYIGKTLYAIATVTLGFGAISCEKEEEKNDNVNTQVNLEQLRNTVIASQWQISQFTQNGADETANYSAYRLEFADDDIVTISNDTLSSTGFWDLDRNENGVNFQLNFNNQPDFEEFQQDWELIDYSSTLVELKKEDSIAIDYFTLDKFQ